MWPWSPNASAHEPPRWRPHWTDEQRLVRLKRSYHCQIGGPSVSCQRQDGCSWLNLADHQSLLSSPRAIYDAEDGRIALKVAPCGSRSTAKRPKGESCGGKRTSPPSRPVLAAAASASSTAKYVSHRGLGRSPACHSSGMASAPPAMWPPTEKVAYRTSPGASSQV